MAAQRLAAIQEESINEEMDIAFRSLSDQAGHAQ